MASQKIPRIAASAGFAASEPLAQEQAPWVQPDWAVDVRLQGVDLLLSPWHLDFVSGFVVEHLSEQPFVVMKSPRTKELVMVSAGFSYRAWRQRY